MFVYIALRWSAREGASFSIDILLRWSKEVFTDKDFFTPEVWYVCRNSNAKVPALQRSAMCVDARFIGMKPSL
ncbi:hypothetical protein F4054_22430 [Candidatus Poribacteria bacterium]|nr:hypothetical protein [Candidatus Poribacteria bacterium]MYG06943.1 hypothetical protein [Candidatus Poribacteria bacterium]MYK25009.1 hypothetical protein [Candidatus Poribacteria bacterium]